MKVFVYFNLHKKLFSVRALEGDRKGLVIAHVNVIGLSDVTFKVSEAGRQRVLREQRKNVHAGVVGTWGEASWDHEGLERVTYNPYKYSTFVNMADETPVLTAKRVVLESKRIFAEIA
jgi:hypothetical protein